MPCAALRCVSETAQCGITATSQCLCWPRQFLTVLSVFCQSGLYLETRRDETKTESLITSLSCETYRTQYVGCSLTPRRGKGGGRWRRRLGWGRMAPEETGCGACQPRNSIQAPKEPKVPCSNGRTAHVEGHVHLLYALTNGPVQHMLLDVP